MTSIVSTSTNPFLRPLLNAPKKKNHTPDVEVRAIVHGGINRWGPLGPFYRLR